jgi:hypothetical protein
VEQSLFCAKEQFLSTTATTAVKRQRVESAVYWLCGLLGSYSFLCKSSAQLLRTKSAGSCHKIGFASEDFSSVILVNM